MVVCLVLCVIFVANGINKKRNEMREKIKNILSNCYTKQGEFDEYKALNELCVLLGVNDCEAPKMSQHHKDL